MTANQAAQIARLVSETSTWPCTNPEKTWTEEVGVVCDRLKVEHMNAIHLLAYLLWNKMEQEDHPM